MLARLPLIPQIAFVGDDMYICTAKQISDIDRAAIEDMKIPSVFLMENAARARCASRVRHVGPG